MLADLDTLYLPHIAELLRKVEETCRTAAELRQKITRQMRTSRAAEGPACDNPEVGVRRITASD